MITKFDELITEIGEYGRFQKLVNCAYVIQCVTGMWSLHVSLFLVPLVDFRCALPETAVTSINHDLTDDSFVPHSSILSGLLNETVPLVNNNISCRHEYSKCYIQTTNNSKVACKNWVFDKSVFEATALEDFSMVCDQSVYRTLTLMAPLTGMFIGSIICGILADRYGRRTTIIGCAVIHFIVNGLLSWAPSFPYFVGFRMISGACFIGLYVSFYVLCMELTGPTKRMWIAVMNNIFGVAGMCVLPAFAYGLRNWHYLSLTVSICAFAVCPVLWFIPESPRWLLTKGCHTKAMNIIKKIAHSNGTVVPVHFTKSEQLLCTSTESKKFRTNDKLWHMLKTPRLATRSFIIVLNWIAVTMGFYGILFNVGTFTSNIFLNFFLASILEIPAYIIFVGLVDRIGRRPLHSASMIIGGMACICSVFPVVFRNVDACHSDDINPVSLTISLIGRLGIAVGFCVLYIYSSELFPTSLRNSCMGFSSMAARIGGIASPFISQLNIGGKFGSAFPLLIFGVITLSAGVSALFLPETLNHKLPDTVADANAFGRKRGSANTSHFSNYFLANTTENEIL